MTRTFATRLTFLGSLFLLTAGPAAADPFCCECKDGTKHLLEESNSTLASGKCSLKCKRPTKARKGVCEVPAAASPAPAAPAPASPAPGTAEPSTAAPSASQTNTGAVSLFKSEDCSGEATRVTQSTSQLGAGFLSYQVDGGVISAYAKANFGGAGTQPILGSMCVSPGWAIASVKVGK